MTRATLHTSFKVKGQRSKLRVTGRLMQTHKMCHIFRTVRPKNFKVCVRMETRTESATSAMTSKVEGHKVTIKVCLTDVGHSLVETQ